MPQISVRTPDMKEKNRAEIVNAIIVIRLNRKTVNLSASLPSQNNVTALTMVAIA